MAQQTGEKREEMGVDLHLQGGREREGEREGARLLLFLRPRQIDRLQLASGLISAVYVTLAESACLPGCTSPVSCSLRTAQLPRAQPGH